MKVYGLPYLFIQLKQPPLVHHILATLLQLSSQLLQLSLVLPQERLLVEVFVDFGFISNILGAISEFQC